MLGLLAVVSKYSILMFLLFQFKLFNNHAHSKTAGGALRHNGDSVLLALASEYMIYGDGFRLELLTEKHRVYSINAGFSL